MSDESLEGGRLPVEIEGKFRPWRYSVSHSELEIRSTDGGDEITRVIFYGVLGMKLKSVYSNLVLKQAGEEVRRDIFRFIGVKDVSGRAIPLLLSDDAGGSFVACLSFVAKRHRGAGEVDGSGPIGDGEVIVRS